MTELTVIIRLHSHTDGELKGTLEEPGGPTVVFRDADELVSTLVKWHSERPVDPSVVE
jgi:hypothetical protein